MKFRFRIAPQLPKFDGSKGVPKFVPIGSLDQSESAKRKELLREIRKEVVLLSDQLKSAPYDQLVWRQTVRSLGSLIETHFNELKAICVAAHQRNSLNLKKNELFVFKLHKNKGSERPRNLIELLLVAVRSYARYRGEESPLGDRLQRSRSVGYFAALRNRITHPKSIDDYMLTRCDAMIVAETTKWLDAVSIWFVDVEIRAIDAAKKKISVSTQEAIDKIRKMADQNPNTD